MTTQTRYRDEQDEADALFAEPASTERVNIPVSHPVILPKPQNATTGTTGPLNAIPPILPEKEPDTPEIAAERRRLWELATPVERSELMDCADDFLPRITKGDCECGTEIYQWFGHTHCPRCIQAYDDREKGEKRQELANKLEADNWVRFKTLCMTFKNSNRRLEEPGIYKTARNWIPRTQNIFIHGPIGCGKTYLARCLLNLALDSMLTICEISGFEFCESTKGGYNSKGAKWLIGPDVLLLDDLDKAPWKDSNLGWLLQVIDRRRDGRFSTIMTSNFSIDRLTKQMEQASPGNLSVPSAIFDRLRPCAELEFKRDTLRNK